MPDTEQVIPDVSRSNHKLGTLAVQEIRDSIRKFIDSDVYQMRDWSAREYCVAIALMQIGVRVELPPNHPVGHPQTTGKVDHTLTRAQKLGITTIWKRLYDAQDAPSEN